MKKLLAILLFTLSSSLFTLCSAQCPWVNVGGFDDTSLICSTGAEYTSFVFDKSNNLYESFFDFTKAVVSVRMYNGSTWSTVGNYSVSKSSANCINIALDKSGTPYVVFGDNAHSGKATVMKLNGSVWDTVGAAGFSIGSTTCTDIVIDTAGTPYVIYVDNGNAAEATVMKYNGSTWVPVGVGAISSGGSNRTCIAISSSDSLYAAYVDVAHSDSVSVQKFNGASWVYLGKAGFDGPSHYSVALSINTAGIPYVAYDNGGRSFNICVQKFSGGKWDSIGRLGFSAYPPFWSSLCFDKSGNLYLGYTEINSAYWPVVDEYSAGNWTQITPVQISEPYSVTYSGSAAWVGVDTAGTPYFGCSDAGGTVLKHIGTGWFDISTPSISKSYVMNNSIAINSLGQPLISYQDGGDSNKISVKKFNGTTWQLLGDSGFSYGDVATTSIAIGPGDTTYVAFMDVAHGGYASVMKFNGTSWVYVGAPAFSPGAITTNSNDGDPQAINIAVDKSGTPYVTYTYGCCAIYVQKFDGTNWVNVGSLSSFGGEKPVLQLDNTGAPYVAYIDLGDTNKISVIKYNGSTWNYVGIKDFTPGPYDNIWDALAIDQVTNNPYVSFAGYGGPVTAMMYNGSAWVMLGPKNFTAHGIDFLTMAVNSVGVPYIAYNNYGYGGFVTVMEYNGSSWVDMGFKTGWSNAIPSIVVSSADTVFVGYADYGGFVKKLGCINSLITSDKSSTHVGDAVSVYPNPNNGQFTIESPVVSSQSSVEIYSILGEKVYALFTIHNSQFVIDLRSQPSGIYFYRVLNNDGSVLGEGKLIIQK